MKNNNLVAEPTVITDDMGIQYDYISNEGAGTTLGLFTHWPAYLIRINENSLSQIKAKIQNGSLSRDDTENTGILSFLKNVCFSFDNSSLSNFLNGLTNIENIIDGSVYCLYNQHETNNPVPKFYSDKDEIIKDFQAMYIPEMSSWSSMTEEEINYWENRREEIRNFFFIICE